MAIHVSSECFIARTPEEVAALMFNPKRDKLWIGGLKGVYPMASGLYEKGSKVEHVGIFLNKHFSAKRLVTKFEENSYVQIYSDEPFEMNVEYRLAQAEGGTKVEMSIASISEILFNSPMSIVSNAVQELIDDNLVRLKRRLEQED